MLRGARRLAGRMRRTDPEPGMGPLLDRVSAALADDETTLTSFLRQVGAAPPRLRIAAMVLGERLGVLKLNGRVTGRSPMSDLRELDGLVAAPELVASAWAAVEDAGVGNPATRNPGGVVAAARRLVANHAFPDPRLISAVHDREAPLCGRDMLLRGRFAGRTWTWARSGARGR